MTTHQLLTDHGYEELLPRLATMSRTEVAEIDTDREIMLTFMRPSMVAQTLAKRIRDGVSKWSLTPDHHMVPEPIVADHRTSHECELCAQPIPTNARRCVTCAMSRKNQ